MTSSLSNLNDHLFSQLGRLTGEDIPPEKIEEEVARTKAIVSVSNQIVRTAGLQLKAAKLFAEHGHAIVPHLPMIGGPKE